MTDEQINLAITKASIQHGLYYAVTREVPDFLQNSEILDEAIRYENKEIRVKFYKEVFKILKPVQRAEAFLKALGKWEEGE